MDDSQYQHMCLMQTNNFYKYKPHSRFFQNVLLVACDGVSKPRTGGWKTTKNCIDFRQANTFVWGLSPGACRRQQPGSCSPRRGRGRLRQRGPLPPSPVGIPAPELLLPLPVGAAPGAVRALLPSGAQPKGAHASEQSPSTSYRSPLISPAKPK